MGVVNRCVGEGEGSDVCTKGNLHVACQNWVGLLFCWGLAALLGLAVYSELRFWEVAGVRSCGFAVESSMPTTKPSTEWNHRTAHGQQKNPPLNHHQSFTEKTIFPARKRQIKARPPATNNVHRASPIPIDTAGLDVEKRTSGSRRSQKHSAIDSRQRNRSRHIPHHRKQEEWNIPTNGPV